MQNSPIIKLQQHHLCYIFKALGRCDTGTKRAVAAWVGRGGNGRGRGAVGQMAEYFTPFNSLTFSDLFIAMVF